MPRSSRYVPSSLQPSLFPPLVDEPLPLASPVPAVPGLVYRHDYVTAAEEVALLAHVDAGPWRSDYRRRTQQYGLGYAGSGRKEPPRWLCPLPDWLTPLAERLAREGVLERAPENVVVNEYEPGQGIGLHVDLPAFGSTVAAVSLGAPCVLDLVEPASGRREALDMAPRSLWVLGGEARARWLHGIAARRNDTVGGVRRPRGRRISITFRTAREELGP